MQKAYLNYPHRSQYSLSLNRNVPRECISYVFSMEIRIVKRRLVVVLLHSLAWKMLGRCRWNDAARNTQYPPARINERPSALSLQEDVHSESDFIIRTNPSVCIRFCLQDRSPRTVTHPRWIKVVRTPSPICSSR